MGLTRTGEREKAAARANAFDRVLAEGVRHALTDEEHERLVEALPRLAQYADEMGVLARPITEWSREEMLAFMSGAIRAANPIRVLTHHDPAMSDRIPF